MSFCDNPLSGDPLRKDPSISPGFPRATMRLLESLFNFAEVIGFPCESY
jgi:hypothetical protein